MNFLKKARILLNAWYKRKERKQRLNETEIYSAVKFTALLGKTPNTSDYPVHPAYMQISLNKLKEIEEFKKSDKNKENLLVIIGDSLSDFTRGDLSCCYPQLNLALAGQGSGYYDRILKDSYESLKPLNIKYLFMECWGNEFLSYFDLDAVKRHAENNYKLARSMYPEAKIMLGTLPPVYDLYANICKYEFMNFLLKLIENDSNSCVIDLNKSMSGFLGIMPKVDYSLEGVHFEGKGIIKYDELIKKGMKSSEKYVS